LVEKGVQTTTSLLERNDQCIVLRSRNRQQNLKDKDDSLASCAMLQQVDNGDDDSGDISGGCGPLSLTHRVTASSKKKPLHSLMKSKESDDSQKQQHNNHPSEKQSDLVANVHKCILTSSAVTKTNLKDLAARKKLERKKIPTKKRGTRVPLSQHPTFFLPLDAPIYFY